MKNRHLSLASIKIIGLAKNPRLLLVKGKILSLIGHKSSSLIGQIRHKVLPLVKNMS